VASHGNIIAAMLHAMDTAFGFATWQAMPNPAMYRVTFGDGEPRAFVPLT
jgi:broad specificity phosphatase PhoE